MKGAGLSRRAAWLEAVGRVLNGTPAQVSGRGRATSAGMDAHD